MPAQLAAARREVSRRLIDYQTRKSLHITMVKSTHAAFRVALIKRNLSMQEVFNHLAALVVEENPVLMKILDEIEIQKRDRHIKQVTPTDADSIFELIESDLVDSGIDSEDFDE